MDDLGCAVNHVLSCHGFRFLLIFFRSLLGYLKDCNVAAHSVDSDIFYVVFLKQSQIVLGLCKLKSVLVCINFMHHDASCSFVTELKQESNLGLVFFFPHSFLVFFFLYIVIFIVLLM